MFMGGMLMMMKRLSSITLVSLLLLQTLAINYLPDAEAASARGGSKDDFSIFSIELGNATLEPETWIQPNGDVQEYMLQDDSVEVTVTVFKDGSVTGTQKQTDAKLEIVHPIGFVIETFTWTTDLMPGGGKDQNTITWNPQEAHSILNTTTNELTGGLIFGYWFNKNLGAFIEGKYNKYWNREWHNFSFGINYKIF